MTASTRTPLIIDTDPGIDDLVAILLALDESEHVSLEAITLTFGNTTLDYCRDNVVRMFDVLHQHVAEDPSEAHRAKLAKLLDQHASPIVLSQGATGPLGGRRFTASYFHGRDGVSGISALPGNPWPVPTQVPAPLQETNKPAHEVILDILRKHEPGTVRIAAIGPLTNIALAWQADPQTFLRVGGISVMGGALDVPGNTTPCAEFNTYADPFAARLLLHDAPEHPLLHGKRLPIDLLPLDVTTQHLIPYARLCDHVEPNVGIFHRFLAQILSNSRRMTNAYASSDDPFDPAKHDQFQAHDPLAVAHAIYCPSPVQRKQNGLDAIDDKFEGWHVQTREFGVETEGVLTRGLCVVDRRGNANAKKGTDQAAAQATTTTSTTTTTTTTTANGQQGSTEADSGKRPSCGDWDVVLASPSIQWVADKICRALAV